MSFYVYMVMCFDGTYYVGVTNNLDRRFAEHEMGIDPGCYTFSRRPLKLVYAGEFRWIDQAIAFEKQLKGWSRRKKRAFIQKNWDQLRRFSQSATPTGKAANNAANISN